MNSEMAYLVRPRFEIPRKQDFVDVLQDAAFKTSILYRRHISVEQRADQ